MPDPYKGLTWNGTRWVCKWCFGKGCLSCPPEPRVLPAPRPADEPPELIDHVFVDDGHGLCGMVLTNPGSHKCPRCRSEPGAPCRRGRGGPDKHAVGYDHQERRALGLCGKRKGVHHLLAKLTYDDLNDPNSEAARIFKPEVLGPEAMIHAFGPDGRGVEEIRENIERARAGALAAVAEAPVTVACQKCGAEQEDFDGFGVLKCETCGYCSHASVDGGVCGLCGAEVSDA